MGKLGNIQDHGHQASQASVSYVIHTPCSSSLSSCSETLGELEACLRHWMLSSGMTYSRTSLSGRPRAVPCLAVEGMASSKIAPLSVVSCGAKWHSSVNLDSLKHHVSAASKKKEEERGVQEMTFLSLKKQIKPSSVSLYTEVHRSREGAGWG